MSQPTPSKKKSPRAGNKVRRWPRYLFFLILLLSLLIGIAQGPALRMALDKELRHQIEQAGLYGNFRVDGSLFSGIEIHDLRLNGAGSLREINADFLTVDYTLLPLIQGNYTEVLTGLRGQGLELWIDLDAPATKSSETAEPDNSGESEITAAPSEPLQLDTIRRYLLPVEIRIHDSAVRISRGSSLLWQATDIAFSHSAHQQQFQLHLGEFTDMDYESLHAQDVQLSWDNQTISLRAFPLRHDTLINEIVASFDNPTSPLIPQHCQARLQWQNANFQLDLHQLQSARAELTNGELKLDSLNRWLNLPERLGGSVTRLQLQAYNLTASPEQLKAEIHAGGSQLRWDDKSIQQVELTASLESGQLRIDSSIQLENEPASQLTVKASLPSTEELSWKDCWHNAKASIDLTLPNPDTLATHLSAWTKTDPDVPDEPPFGGWPQGEISLQAQARLEQATLASAEAQMRWQAPHWADLNAGTIQLDAQWDPEQQQANANIQISDILNGELKARASYLVETQEYRASLDLNALDFSRLQPLLAPMEQPVPRGGILQLSWSGEGHIDDILSHQGSLDTTVSGLEIEQPGSPATDIKLSTQYSKGLRIRLEELELSRDKLRLKTLGKWEDDTLELQSLELHDQDARLIHGNIRLPLSRQLTGLDAFLEQTGEIQLQLKTDQLPVAEIYEQLTPGNPPAVTGKITLDCQLSGTLKQPEIDLGLYAKRIKATNTEQAPLTDLKIELKSEQQSLSLSGKIEPDGHKPLVLQGTMPYLPRQWIDTPEKLLETPVEASLDTRSINLEAFTHLLPQIDELKGSFSSIVQLTGTIGEPKIKGKSRLQISRVSSTRPSIPNLRDIDVSLSYDDQILTLEPSSCLVAGGQYSLIGTIDFNDFSMPVFDIALSADKVLLWRDDAIIARSDGTLKLTGPLEKAHLSGDIGLVQSLFYKDVQIIPIGGGGRGNNQRGKAKLPSFSSPTLQKGDTLNIPSPYNQWTLDLKTRTIDDFLIRGNIAKGSVKGQVQIGGTLGKPEPKGEIVIREAQGSLPFSRLHIKEGKAFFTPERGFDPQLSIKATSRVGSYDVDISLYGPASNPKTLMTSRPPLPENEIIFLLATGSTSEQLTDGASATGKAYQLLVDSVIRSSPSRFRRIMNTIAELNEKVDINIGASDPFTGRKYNSARVDITDRWHFVASIDLDNNTRGLVVYAIQFK